MNEMGKNVNLLSDSFSGLQFKLFTQMKRQQQQQSQTKKFALGINFQAPLFATPPLLATPGQDKKTIWFYFISTSHDWRHNLTKLQLCPAAWLPLPASLSLSLLPLPLLATCSWPATWAFFLVALLFSNCWLTNLMWNSIWERIAMRLGRGCVLP